MTLAGIAGPVRLPADAFELSQFGFSVESLASGALEWKLNAETPFGNGIPGVYSAAVRATHLSTVTFSFRSRQIEKYEFFVIELENAVIESTSTSATTSGAESASVVLTFSFAAVQLTFVPLKPDGSRDVPVVVSWDLERGSGHGPAASSFAYALNARVPGAVQLTAFSPAAPIGEDELSDATLGLPVDASVIEDVFYVARRSVLPDGHVQVFLPSHGDKGLLTGDFGFTSPMITAVNISGMFANVRFDAAGYEWTTIGYGPDGAPLPPQTSSYP